MQMRNVVQRIENDIRSYLPSGTPFNLVAERSISDAWRGASAWASCADSARSFTSRGEYDEFGPEYVMNSFSQHCAGVATYNRVNDRHACGRVLWLPLAPFPPSLGSSGCRDRGRANGVPNAVTSRSTWLRTKFFLRVKQIRNRNRRVKQIRNGWE